MGLQALAAGLVIKVKDNATGTLKTVGKGFDSLREKGDKLRSAASSASGALKGFAVAGAGVAAILGAMGKQAIDFEKQMSAVRAITGLSRADMAPLTAEIKRLGATTVFSATEAAQGAENLARAGFSSTEIIAALGGVLNAAAADGIDLATASNIVASNVRAFGLEAGEAVRVADALAGVSANANVNMTQLGEALKFVAPVSRTLGVSIEETAIALGILGDAGLQGSIGGTALKNAMIKLAKPTKEGAALMKRFGFEAQTTNGKLDMRRTLANLLTTMQKIPNRLDKVAFGQEVFGIRGAAAMDNFVAAMEVKGKDFGTIVDDMAGKLPGAAKRMADVRVDNVAGAFTLLGSALEGLAIEVFSGKLGDMKDNIKFVADAVGVLVIVLQNTAAVMRGDANPELDAFRAKYGAITDTLIQFGVGMKKGLDYISLAVEWAKRAGTEFTKTFGPDADLTTGLGTALVVAAPVVAILGVLAGAASIVAAPFLLAGEAILGVLSAVGLGAAVAGVGLGVFAGTVNATKGEGESFGGALMRTFGDLLATGKDFFDGVQSGVDTYIMPAFESMKTAGKDLLAAFDPVFSVLGDSFASTGSSGFEMGETIIAAIGAVAKVLSWLVSNILAPVIGFFMNNFVAGFISGIADVVGGFMDLVSGTGSVSDSLLRILGGVAKTFLNIFVTPLRMAIDAVISAAEVLGLGDNEIVKGAKGALEVLRFKEGPLAAGRSDATQADANARFKARQDQRAAGVDAALRKPGAAAAAASSPVVNVTAKAGDQKIDVKNTMNIDGREITAATGKVELENLERLGGVQTPYFNRGIKSAGNTSIPRGR